MPKSLAERRLSAASSGRPERAEELCLVPELTSQAQRLIVERGNLRVQLARGGDDDQARPPQKAASPETARLSEVESELADLYDRIDEESGLLVMRATPTNGEWFNWANAHPPRGEDEPGFARDNEVTGGRCNTDALVADLAKYTYSWNGEPLSEGDWDAVFAPVISGGDLKALASHVVDMYEQRVNLGEWARASRATLSKSASSASPETSESVPVA